MLYIDPTAGGFILQTTLAGLTGLVVIIRLFFWGLVKSWFSPVLSLFRKRHHEDTTSLD